MKAQTVAKGATRRGVPVDCLDREITRNIRSFDVRILDVARDNMTFLEIGGAMIHLAQLHRPRVANPGRYVGNSHNLALRAEKPQAFAVDPAETTGITMIKFWSHVFGPTFV